MNLHKKIFSKIGSNYLIYAISAIIFQIIIVNIIGIINYDWINNFNLITILSAICNYILPLPILLFLMRKIESEKIEKKSISIKTFLIYLSVTFTLLWIGNILGLISTTLIGNFTGTSISNPVQNLINSADMWLNLLLISIIGPVFEELLFRKLLIDRTIKYGARVSIILSAVLFGFIHGNLNQFFYAFLMGGFFAYIYIKTGKVIYTILLHISVNLMGSVVSLFVVESANRIIENSYTSFDMTLVVIYLTLILAMIFIGIIGLSKIKKAKFNGSRTRIALKYPLKTIFTNYGIICFIIFCIMEMIIQIV